MIEPNPELSASLQQRRLAVEPPADAAHAPVPLPPLEPPPDPPIALLERAAQISRDLGEASPLRMQVLRQLRMMHARMGDVEGARRCEREIDALQQLLVPTAAETQPSDSPAAAAPTAREGISTAQQAMASLQVSGGGGAVSDSSSSAEPPGGLLV